MSGPEHYVTSSSSTDPGDDTEGPSLPAPSGITGVDAAAVDPVIDSSEEASGSDEPRRAALGRAATLITVCNLISRISGFVRVVAVAGALGIVFLGDSYQRANEVSNVLFELLIGGLLFSILIPSFVTLLSRSDETGDANVGGQRGPAGARHLGSVLATRGAVAVGVIALAGMFGGTWIMRLLTLGVTDGSRADQIRLGAFLMWFIMPQLVFYAVGSVASALLQADHRFLATSIAPLFNNIVVTATMVVFAHQYDPARGFDLTLAEKVLLGGGTLAGTVAMTIVPFVALWHAGLSLRPRWHTRGVALGALVRRGAWAVGHVGLNEVLILATIVLAGRVDGGVIAYQTAFMFFLLPHALLAYPIFTALFPRLSRQATAQDRDGFAVDLALGVRSMVLLLIPASGLLAVVAMPALSVVRIGELDTHGVRLVAFILAGYLVGLCAYSLFFLLTRASYAVDDARSPTLVNLAATVVAVVAMVICTIFLHGTAMLVSFGLIQAVVLIGGVVVLFRIVGVWVDRPLRILGALGRSVAASVPAVLAALGVSVWIGWNTRAHAIGAAVASGALGVVVALVGLTVLKTPELRHGRQLLVARLARHGGS